ncbi:MAG: hypothetical protein H7258_01650 [Ferruginibacter sp.]|nr:hypothetical protein [Ferruginibacter sp.]
MLVGQQTGASKGERFIVLNRKGANKLKQVEIFVLTGTIEQLKDLGAWNRNLLALTYEWSRGLKERGKKERGFEVSISKTINNRLQHLYNSGIGNTIKNK